MNIETHPTIQDMFQQYSEVMCTFINDEEAGKRELHKLIDNFNEKYKIIPRGKK